MLVVRLIDQVRYWVIQELEFTGREKNARSLEAYWMNEDIGDLVDILEDARLPEPMLDNPS